MTSFVPPGYMTLDEALNQLLSTWGQENTISRQDAWARLRGHLFDGTLPCVVLTEHGHIFDAAKSAWAGKEGATPPKQFAAARPPNAHPLAGVSKVRPLIDRKAMKSFLEPSEAKRTQVSVIGPTERSKGGRSPTYSAALFLIEAAKLLYDGANFKTPAELRQRALEEYHARTGHLPSDDWAKPYIRDLWNRLMTGD